MVQHMHTGTSQTRKLYIYNNKSNTDSGTDTKETSHKSLSPLKYTLNMIIESSLLGNSDSKQHVQKPIKQNVGVCKVAAE